MKEIGFDYLSNLAQKMKLNRSYIFFLKAMEKFIKEEIKELDQKLSFEYEKEILKIHIIHPSHKMYLSSKEESIKLFLDASLNMPCKKIIYSLNKNYKKNKIIKRQKIIEDEKIDMEEIDRIIEGNKNFVLRNRMKRIKELFLK